MAFLVLAVGVLFIIVAIAILKIHPFIALLLAAFLVGVLSPVPLTQDETAQPLARKAVQSLELTASELGSTAGSIAIVIVLAAIIGQCLMESGAADKITRRLLSWLGEPRAGSALMGSGYLLSIPVFFDTVFFLLIPLARALRLRTGHRYALYVMAIAGGAVITHSLVPPTPGPLLMVENFAPLGLTLATAIAIGFLMGLLPAAVGLWFSHRSDQKLNLPLRDSLGASSADLQKLNAQPETELPGLGLSLMPVLAPILLITFDSVVQALHASGSIQLSEAVLVWSAFAGNKNFALLVAAGIAMGLLWRHADLTLAQLRERLEPAVMSAGVIILITSAGGAFGKMLARTGVSESLRDATGEGAFSATGLILLAFGLASIMKIAQGSGTVSMITASAMVVALVGPDNPLPCHPIYLFAAVGFGSMVISWMNDSGFWVVGKMSGFTEKETFATWTRMLAVIGLTGLLQTLLLAWLFPSI